MQSKGQSAVSESSATFVTLLGSVNLESRVRLAIASLREFGGSLAASPVLVYAPAALQGSDVGRMERVELRELEPDAARYPFTAKVRACAEAEVRLAGSAGSLVWLGAGCLVLRPPDLFALGSSYDAAFRPVHVANVGSPRSGPLDEYWARVYAATGTDDRDGSVESLLDRQQLRPYYNTHCFSIDPGLGLMAEWRRVLCELVADEPFQSGPCRDELHRIFLHQAVLSALISGAVSLGRLRILPPGYSYPLHFHAKLADEQRARVMNDVTVAAYEDDADLAAVPADEPLRSWLGRLRPGR